MIQGRTVLIIDQFNDTREVLRTVLESVGLKTVEAKRASQGLELARRHRPDLVVLDLEGGQSAAANEVFSADQESGWDQIPMVLLGRAKLEKSRVADAAETTDWRYLSKPFQFKELVETIETLLSDQQRANTGEAEPPMKIAGR